MKLRIEGSVNDRGQAASFSDVLSDLDALKGKQMPLGIQDVYLVIDQIEERLVKLRLIRFRDVDVLTLRLGDRYAFDHEGNAYSYRLQFVGVE